MAKFFSLNGVGEDKLITRETRIYTDVSEINIDNTFNITTKSNAKKLKIKFFLDAMIIEDDVTGVSQTFSIGKYIEMEHGQRSQQFFSAGFYSFTYTCTDNDGEGNFTWALEIEPVADKTQTLLISNVNFEDSFYDPTDGWTNTDNPNNIIDDIVPETNPGLPPGGVINDLLVTGTAGPEWRSPSLVTETLDHATDNVYGTVKIDNETIINNSENQISVPFASDSVAGVVKVDGETVQINSEGQLIATTGGGTPTTPATPTTFGTVKYDNVTIQLNGDNQLYAVGGGGGNSPATPNEYGIVKYDDDTIKVNGNGQLYSVGGGATPVDPATPTSYGTVKYDDTTIKENENGQLYAVSTGGGTVPATPEQYGTVKYDDDTIKVNPDGQLYANVSGGAGIDYSLEEQDTGLKWIDGKNIYVKTTVVTTNNTEIANGVEDIVKIEGIALYQTTQGYNILDYNNTSLYSRLGFASSGQTVTMVLTGLRKINCTLYYTKV